MIKINKILRGLLALFCFYISVAAHAESRKIVISEFMAINSSTLQDEEGEYSDWIELHNPGDSTINLLGWFLTDKADNLSKWMLPNISIKADEYIIIYASEKDRYNPAEPLHTNFKLSGSGEFLAIVEPGGEEISHSFGDFYPAQTEDVSYGLFHGQAVSFYLPTPGAPNTLADQPVPPVFSHTRNFYSAPFNLELSTISAGNIYYTLDGTIPSKTTGTLYQGPITIDSNLPVSAITVNEAGVSSEVTTNTYLFIDKVVSQPNNPVGYPSTWSPLKFKNEDAPADYEMDPQVVNNSAYKDLMDDALTAIPTLSLVTNPGYFFSHDRSNTTGGIYIFTGNTGAGSLGIGWERPVSMEFFDPNSHKEFQVNCGVLLHGGNSRVPDNSQKHSLRLSFRSQYGPSKLKFNFFEDESGTNEFNSLVLRAGYNYSWMKNDPKQRENAQYLQDPFAKKTQQDMDHPSAHQRFVHLYINGLYWGVYNVSEKLTDDFMASYLKGKEDEFDVVKDHSGIVDGERKAWDQLMNEVSNGLQDNASYFKVQGKNADGTENASYQNLLDVENLIDYMQLHMYIGNEDWDHNNWIAARNRVDNKDGFRFFSWDSETSMTDVRANMTNENNDGNPSEIYQELRKNAEFKLLFADHIQENFFNGGPLSPEAAIARYSKLAEELDLPIIAESARWGDYRKDVAPSDNVQILYTRNEHWFPKKQDLLENYFPQRSGIVVNQFKAMGLFPSINAPSLSHTEGVYAGPIDLTLTTNTGDIYYTLDGTDPRVEVTSAISSQAIKYNSSVHIADKSKLRARAISGTTWSPLTKAKYEFDATVPVEETFADNLSVTAYPNPFTAFVQFDYTIPANGYVKVELFSIDGKHIRTLASGNFPEGDHSVIWNATDAKSGIYLYKISYQNQSIVGKIMRR